MTFTSCKDYDDDISGVRDTANQNESAISALQTQLTTLQTAATTAQTAADAAKTAAAEAKTAADAAKAAGDEAKADAATAKAKAEEAIAAAAQAKADAITEAKAEVAALKTLMESELAGKLDESVFDAALLVLNAKIEGIEDGLSTLGEQVDGIDGRVVENTAAIRTAEEAITALIAADADLQLQLDALTLYAEATRELADNNAEAIEAAQEDILAAQEEIADLWAQLADDKEELLGLIGENTSAIALLAADLEATNQSIEDLKEAIEDELDAIKADITGIQGDIADINTQILAINGNLASLHTLIVNRLTAITLASNAYVDGIEAIIFNSLKYKPMEAGENAAIPTTGYNLSTAAPAIASYKFNPRSFNLANADYNYVDRTATIISTGLRSAASNWVEIEGAPVKNAADGTVNFTLHRLNAHDTQPASGKGNVIALEATLKGDAVDQGETGVVIAAEQELVYDNILDANNVRIADKATLTTDGVDAHYPVTFADAVAGTIWYEDMTYDKIYDLKAKVATCANDDTHAEFDIDAYNLKYKFSVASSAYNITTGSTTTNQQTWIELVDGDAGTFKAEDFNKEAIGRTPILKVELVDEAGNVVRRAFVKVKIGVKKSDDISVGTFHDLVFKCDATTASYELSEQYIRENVYRIITNTQGQTSLSHEEFWNLYEFDNASVIKNGLAHTMTVPAIVDGDAGEGTATKKIVWNFTHTEIGSVGAGGATLVGSVTVRNKLASSEFPAKVTFKFTVNVKLPEFSLNKVENDIYWLKDGDEYVAYKVNVLVPESTTSPAWEAQFRTSLPQAYSTYTVTNSSTACTTNYFKVISTTANGVVTNPVMAGVQIDGTNITLDKSNNAVKKALNSPLGLQALIAHIYVLENGDEVTVNEFLVTFIRPVNLNMPSGVTVTDATTGGDVADFQWNGILTDWRGEAIVSPEWNRVERSASFWRNVYTPDFEWVDGHYVQLTDASLNVEYGEVEFTVGAPTTLYYGEATYLFQTRLTSWSEWTTQETKVFTSGSYLTHAEVEADLEAQRAAAETAYQVQFFQDRVLKSGDTRYRTETVQVGQLVKYTYVKSVTYVPATYEWVEGKFVEKPYTPESYPAYEGTTEGQLSNGGQWEWTVWTWNAWDWTPGQYWFYYGPFGNITADFNNVTTNLTYNGGQLPSSVTLEQVGNTVKYVNVGAPIGYAYEIYIPVTVNYGWGTTSSVLTIKVEPVN